MNKTTLTSGDRVKIINPSYEDEYMAKGVLLIDEYGCWSVYLDGSNVIVGVGENDVEAA